MSAMDTTRNRIMYLGGYPNKDHHIYTISSNSFAVVTLTGASAGAVQNGEQAAMVYVAGLDSYLVRLDGSTGPTVYQVNAGNFAVTAFATSGGASIPAPPNAPFNRFLYVPRLGGVVYVPTYAGNVWFMRVL